MNERTDADVPANYNHQPPRHTGMGIKAIIGFVALFGILLVLGLLPRLRLKPQLESDAAAARTAPPIVTFVMPRRGPATTQLELPGNVQGSEDTEINARVSGYVRKWYADIGDHVKAGQVLADIETPDTQQQVAQAQAQVAGSQASAQQAQANVVMMTANADQALANIAKAQAAYSQSKSDLAHSQAAVSQAQQQSDQQRAQVVSAKATLSLAKLTAERYESLAKEGATAQQTADQQQGVYETSQANLQAMESALRASQANIRAAQESVVSAQSNVRSYAEGIAAAKAAYAASQANVQASKSSADAAKSNVASNAANLQRNNILQGFSKVVAPFDGIITARNVDVGNLVSAAGTVATSGTAGSGTTSGATGLFSMVRGGDIRVFVSVPQQFAGSVRKGQQVQLVIGDPGAKPIQGVVNRDASALDPTSRTLLAQIDVPNPGGKVRPGTFATVTMNLPNASGAWRIPDTALVSGADGSQIAVVTAENTIHFQDVTIGRDYGKEMDVNGGLTGTEKIVSNPSNALTEGLNVKAELAKPEVAPGGAGGPGGSGPGGHGTGGPGGPGGGRVGSTSAMGANAPGMGGAPSAGTPADGQPGQPAPVGGTASGGASPVGAAAGGTSDTQAPVGAAPVGGGTTGGAAAAGGSTR